MFPGVIVGKEALRLLRISVSRNYLWLQLNPHVQDYNLFPTGSKPILSSKISADMKEKQK